MFKPVNCLLPRLRVSARFASNAAYNTALASLKKDLKQAMIAKDDVRKSTIRSLLSTIKNKEIDSHGKELDVFSLSEIYTKLVNQRTDSIEEFLKNGRDDLVSKEKQELAILESYLKDLPVASKEEVDCKVKELLTSMRETTPDLQLKQVLSKLDWSKLPTEWNASANVIKGSIVSQFKNR